MLLDSRHPGSENSHARRRPRTRPGTQQIAPDSNPIAARVKETTQCLLPVFPVHGRQQSKGPRGDSVHKVLSRILQARFPLQTPKPRPGSWTSSCSHAPPAAGVPGVLQAAAMLSGPRPHSTSLKSGSSQSHSGSQRHATEVSKTHQETFTAN